MSRGMQLVSLQAESIEPMLQHGVVDVVLLEWLALGVDERRTRRRPQIHQLGQVPEIELHEVLGRPRRNLFCAHDSILQFRLELSLPRSEEHTSELQSQSNL